MQFLNTEYKRKSATITTIIMMLLLLLIFVFGLKYMDPPIESGIAVNFGTSNVGSGDTQPTEPVKSKVNPQVIEEEVNQESEETPNTQENVPSEKVLTQDTEDSIAIKQKEQEAKEQKEAEDAAENERIEAERIKQEEADRIQKERDDKKRKLDALIGGIDNKEGTETGGDGDDDQSGDKGKVTGDPNASGFYGNGGNGNGGDYQLGNRKPIDKPKPAYQCEEEGLVVVTVEVNRAGKVIKAVPGTKGTTNTASCLLSQAKIAALKTTWEPDSDAGERQIGVIKYRFSLRD